MEGHIVHSLVKSNYYVECIRHPRGQRMRRGEAMPRPCCWRKEGPILCSFSLLPCLHCKSVKSFCSTELGHPLGLGICMHGVCAYLLPLSQEKQKKKMREMCMYQNAFGNILLFLMILKKSYPLSVCSSLLKPLLYKNSEFRKSFMDRKYLSAKKLAFVFKF